MFACKQDTNTCNSTPKIEFEASTILYKILLTEIPRAVFSLQGRIHSCPVGGRLEKRYLDRSDSIFIGTYDIRATMDMIVDDLHLTQYIHQKSSTLG